jgi:hypothetical protein
MRLWTDFNYMEDEDTVWADLDQAESYFEDELQLGRRASLFDGVGHECMGNIIALDLDNRMVELVLDWDTWSSTTHPQSELHYSAGYYPEFASKNVTHERVA